MSEARIIDGKAFAGGLRARIAEDVAKLKALHRVQPGLAVVLVGEDPASQIYVKSKGEQTKAAGMHSEEHRLPPRLSGTRRMERSWISADDPLPAACEAVRFAGTVARRAARYVRGRSDRR